MSTAIEYATYIIDLTDAMLVHQQGLNEQQTQRVQMIGRRAVDFITEFLQYESTSAPTLLDYLTHAAQNPLRIILGCSHMMLAGHCGPMDSDYEEAVQEIFDCGTAMVEEVQQMRMDLQSFMESIGMME